MDLLLNIKIEFFFLEYEEILNLLGCEVGLSLMKTKFHIQDGMDIL